MVGVESTHTSWIFSDPIPFKVNEVKENPSDEKKLFEGPTSLGFDEKFLQFVPETLEHSSLHFSDDQIASLIPKIGNKIGKKTVLLNQIHTGPSTFGLSLPKFMG